MLNRGVNMAVIEANNQWRDREIGRGVGKGLNMIATYTQV